MEKLQKNIDIVTKMISDRIGFYTINRKVATDILSEYKESNVRTVRKIIVSNGVCKTEYVQSIACVINSIERNEIIENSFYQNTKVFFK